MLYYLEKGENKLRKTLIAFSLIFTLILLTACSGASSVSNDSEDDSTVSETMSTDSSDDVVSDQSNLDNINILFIGNSLTYVGEIPEKMIALLKQEGKTVKVFEKTSGGYKLYQHLSELKNESNKSLITNSDIVVLQEYGTYGHDTANSVIEIQKLFKEGTKFYFLLTEFDVGNRLYELKDVQNISYIPSGYAHNLLLEKGFTYEQLHAVNDYHPNSLYGYIATLTVYSTIFTTSCIDMSYDFLNESTKNQIPGTTQAEKDQSIALIQESIMEAIETKLTIND